MEVYERDIREGENMEEKNRFKGNRVGKIIRGFSLKNIREEQRC